MSSPAIPEHLKKYQNKTEDNDSQTLSDSGNPTIPRLSIKGGKFRYIQGEEESKKFTAVDVVVVGVDPEGGRMIKNFYKGAFDPSNPEPPDCSSINGVVPDSWVPEPQASACAKCPQNAFGTAVNAQGQRGKGKACKDSKWLWLVKLEEIDHESPTVWCLNVPASSLKALSKFGREVNKTGLPLHVIHARIELDDEFDYPVLNIQIQGYLNEEQCAIADEVHQDKPWREMVGDTSIPQGAIPHRSAERIAHQTDTSSKADDQDAEADQNTQTTVDNPENNSPDAAVENW